MRDRLIELLNEAHKKFIKSDSVCEFDFFADYLLENGVIVPSCLIGTTVYEIRARGKRRTLKGYRKCDYGIATSLMFKNALCCGMELYVKEKAFVKSDKTRLNKTIFLSEEEAKAKIALVEGWGKNEAWFIISIGRIYCFTCNYIFNSVLCDSPYLLKEQKRGG